MSEIRLKYLFSKRIGGAWGDEPQEDNAVICIRAADFNTDVLTHNTENLTRRSFDKNEVESKKLIAGDLIIEKSGGGENQPVGRVVKFNLDEPALCSNFLELLRPDKSIANSEYLAYLFYTLWNNRVVTKAIKQTTGIQNLDISDYLDNKIHLPELTTQNRIVSYLNKHVAHIDNLIQQKQKQIETLEEKRQVLITQAVTKGTNPKVKLKDSGIDWLGQIPEHWNVKKLKYISFLKSGEFITSENIKPVGDYPVYGGNGLRGYTSGFTHSGHYVLIGRQGALCGNINYANDDFWASEHAIVCNPIQDFNVIWLGELLRIMNLNQYSVSAAQPGLSVEVIKNLKVPAPSKEEQDKIFAFLKIELERIDKINQNTLTSLELLQEKRATLISDAVTGKIYDN